MDKGKAKRSIDRLGEIRMFLLDLSHHCPAAQWQEEGKKYLEIIDQIIEGER